MPEGGVVNSVVAGQPGEARLMPRALADVLICKITIIKIIQIIQILIK